MQTQQYQIVLGSKKPLGDWIDEALSGFDRIVSKYSDVFYRELNKVGLETSMVVVVTLTTEDFIVYDLNILCGGGKYKNLLLPRITEYEKSELANIVSIIHDCSNKYNFILQEGGAGYYGFP
ncbi:MAG: hypothetical protein AAF741_05760 [Bacteroidota bacterium]